MFKALVLATLVAMVGAASSGESRRLGRGMDKMIKVTVKNLVYSNPLGPFFVVVHDKHLSPLYTLGEPAPDNGLQTLAEEGDPSELVSYYSSDNMTDHVGYVGSFIDDAALNLPEGAAFLLELGESSSMVLPVDKDYSYVSMASMLVNTNDAFAGFSAMELKPGMMFTVPAYDAGTEENNESCTSVPGPACGGHEMSGNGEGYVHVHRGIHGMFNGMATDLDPSVYDWRNPALLVMVEDY